MIPPSTVIALGGGLGALAACGLTLAGTGYHPPWDATPRDISAVKPRLPGKHPSIRLVLTDRSQAGWMILAQAQVSRIIAVPRYPMRLSLLRHG